MMDIMKPKLYTYEETLQMIIDWKKESKRVYRTSTVTNVSNE
jgi:hypothetical protein